MSNITKNFAYAEFRTYGAPSTWLPLNDYQKFLIDNLAKNLQIIRDHLLANCSMTITSAVRNEADFSRLSILGYHPAEASDHYCGNAIMINPSSKNFKKYGRYYYLSSGAADIVPSGISVEELFQLAVKLTRSDVCKFGQIILEEDRSRNTKWVHFANDYNLIFSKDVINFLGREKFLTTNDGGKTYKIYN